MSAVINYVARTVADYLGFYTSGAPTVVTTTEADGTLTTTTTSTPTMYVTPNVTMRRCFIARLTLGSNAASGQAATRPASFSSHRLAALDWNPPLTNFTMSKIISVRLRIPPSPHDVNWSAKISLHLEQGQRDHDAVERVAPNVMWVWRSNVTVLQEIEHAVPWPHGFPVMDSVHATMPGLHAPALHIGFHNQPHHTATALPAGQISFLVLMEAEVAGYGMLGTI